MENVQLIRERIRTARSRQKSYADNRRRELEFAAGDHVFLKVSPTKGTMRFGLRGKLSPRYVGPFQILDRVGPVAYRVALPPALARVHNVFHVSMLKKCVRDPDQVVELEPLNLQEDLTYEEQPIKILDTKVKQLRQHQIRYVKVQWSRHSDREATWELESEMRQYFPYLLDE